jgi:hypothetical protein
VHQSEQDSIAATAGALPVGAVGKWQVVYAIPIKADEQGEVTVSRLLGGPGIACKEIVFSVVHQGNDRRSQEFYTATICQDDTKWKWAPLSSSARCPGAWGSANYLFARHLPPFYPPLRYKWAAIERYPEATCASATERNTTGGQGMASRCGAGPRSGQEGRQSGRSANSERRISASRQKPLAGPSEARTPMSQHANMSNLIRTFAEIAKSGVQLNLTDPGRRTWLRQFHNRPRLIS